MKKIVCALFFLHCSLFGLTPSLFLDSSSTFVVEADWLYFSPTSETSYYAISVSGAPFVRDERKANRFDDFFSGYRISAAYLPSCCCNLFIAAIYSHFDARHSDAISATFPPSFLLPTLGPPGLYSTTPGDTAILDEASDDKKINYNAIDALVGHQFFSWHCLNIIGFGGLHFVNLSTKENFFYSIFAPTPFRIFGELKSKFCGLGPELGFALNYTLGCNFFLKASAAAAWLIGKPLSMSDTDRFSGDVLTAFGHFKDERAWRIVPYTNVQIALNYCLNSLFQRWECRTFSGMLTLGYEIPVYFNALSDLTFTDFTEVGMSFDKFRNFTMHGPFLGLTVSY